MRLYSHFYGTVYLFQGQRIDRPTYGAGHVPSAPTEAQARSCLFDCNRLRAEWVKWQEHVEKMEAERRSGEDVLEGPVSHDLD